MGRLRGRAPTSYRDPSDDDGGSDAAETRGDDASPQQLLAARQGPAAGKQVAAPRQALGNKRAGGDANGAPANRRRRSSPAASSGSEEAEAADDPIESADEEDSEEQQPEAEDDEADEFTVASEEEEEEAEDEEEEENHSGGSGWEDEEVVVAAPRRTSRLPTRGGGGGSRRQSAEDGEERVRPHRAAAAAAAGIKPDYRDHGSDEEEEEEAAGSEAAASDDDEGEEEQHGRVQRRRQQQQKKQQAAAAAATAAHKPATRRGGARPPQRKQAAEGARRSARDTQRICYNLEALEAQNADLAESSSSGSEDEDEEESSDDGDFESDGENDGQVGAGRPTRRAAKAAGKAIRKQAGGGGGKRRKQPKRAAAPAKRRQVVASSEDEAEGGDKVDDEDEQSGSGSGSGSEDGSGSEEHEDGSSSDEDAGLDYGRFKVEKILDSRHAKDGSGEEFLCKFQGKSYRTTHWLPYDVLAVDRQQLVRNFQRKKAAGEVDPYGDLQQGVHPDWLLVDRVIAERTRAGGRSFLVKWRGLGYSECTWEAERDLAGDQAQIERYERYSVLQEDEEEEGEAQEIIPTLVPDFCNSRQLRDYQLLSLEWNIRNWCKRTNCMLGDEMGLGKTAQSISVLAFQKQFGSCRGPFLVIAPLTTLGHWQREIETWTDMNCVVYAGGAADRQVIQKHDLYFPASAGGGRRRQRVVKPNVVLASYETVLKDQGLFRDILWQTVIIDEAHRMKSTGSSTRQVIASMDIEWLLLLTGTPVQNNMRELYGILNLLNPEEHGDEATFLDLYGDERTGMTPDQVRALQTTLRPILLRRMKEDVETLPEKEEVIIWVELTPEQRLYYKAIYEDQIGTLLAGVSAKNMPNMRNLAMELRKVCCHPYLCNGLEDDIQHRKAQAGVLATEVDQLVQASGKMVLLHKLLPKLKREGHKVLIFSQFKIMLDVLEDYVKMCGHACERIDGSTSSRDRQAAIDRYSKEGSDGFVFLLSTRAGGQGITLTAADTCIIYDSDWNPQNDLQAMARCHRIGQEREVTIYRLVSNNTYEQNVFEISSRKYGLDEAILGNLGTDGGGGSGGSGGNPEEDSRKIADLLKHGAHCLHGMGAANEQGDAFVAEGIDDILQGRTEKRQIGGRAGSTFSVATFAVGASAASSGGDDKSYWSSLLPEAVAGHDAAAAAARAPVILAPRRRKQIDYKGQLTGRNHHQEDAGDVDFVLDISQGGGGSDDDGALVMHKVKKQRKAEGKESAPAVKRWKNDEVKEFMHALLLMGPGRTEDVRREAKLLDRSAEECRELEAGMLRALEQAGVLQARRQGAEWAQRDASIERDIDGGLLGGGGGGAAAAAAAGGGSGEGQQQQAREVSPGAAAAAEGKAAEGKGGKHGKELMADLLSWIEAEMGDVAPAVAQALSTKVFTEWAAPGGVRYCQHMKQRKVLAAWAASGGAGAGDNDVSPGGTVTDRRLPWMRAKAPAHWWREADSKALLQGVHELGWPQRGRKEKVEAILKSQRFGFRDRLAVSPTEQQPQQAPAPAPAAGGGEQQSGAEAQAMDVDDQQQQQAAAAAAGCDPQAAAAAAAAAKPAFSLAPPPQDGGSSWPKMHTKQEWAVLVGKATKWAESLMHALEQPQQAPPKHGFGTKAAAAGTAMHRVGSGQGSTTDLHKQQQQQQLAKQQAAAAAAAAAAGERDDISSSTDAGGASGSPSKPSGAVHQQQRAAAAPVPAAAAAAAASDATPHGAAGKPAATTYTNPLTSQGAGGGGSGGKPAAAAGGSSKPASGGKQAAGGGGGEGGGARKAQLPLQPTTGGHKGKVQKSIFSFMKQPAAAAAAATAPAGASGACPGASQQAAAPGAGQKENQRQQQQAGQEVIMID